MTFNFADPIECLLSVSLISTHIYYLLSNSFFGSILLFLSVSWIFINFFHLFIFTIFKAKFTSTKLLICILQVLLWLWFCSYAVEEMLFSWRNVLILIMIFFCDAWVTWWSFLHFTKSFLIFQKYGIWNICLVGCGHWLWHQFCWAFFLTSFWGGCYVVIHSTLIFVVTLENLTFTLSEA